MIGHVGQAGPDGFLGRVKRRAKFVVYGVAAGAIVSLFIPLVPLVVALGAGGAGGVVLAKLTGKNKMTSKNKKK